MYQIIEKKTKKGNGRIYKCYKHPKTGKLMIASEYGKKAFKLWISK